MTIKFSKIIVLTVENWNTGVCLYIDYFFPILRFLSVSYKTKTIRVVFSFGVCLSVCLFVGLSVCLFHYHLKTAGWIFTKLGIRNLRTPE